MEGTKAGLLGILWWGRNCPALKDGREQGAQARYRDPGTAVASEISFWKISGRRGRQTLGWMLSARADSKLSGS
jgi:hypothetical protein